MSVASVAIQFSIVDLLSKGIDNIKNRLKSAGGASREFQQNFNRMGKSFKYAAFTGIATRQMYKGLKPAVSLAGDLQAEMLGTRAELAGSIKDAGALASKLKEIKSTAFSVQAWTPFDMGQIVALEKKLLKSGAKAKDIIGSQGAAASAAALAVYENLDPVAMGKSLISIGTPFKVQASEYMNLADLISRAASASTVGASEITDTARYAAPVMASLKRSPKELMTLAAMLARSGIEASMAGTGLRQFFNAAVKQRALKTATGDLKSLAEIIEALRKRTAKFGDADKLEFLTKMFDIRGASVALALMAEGEASYVNIAETMSGALSLQEKINIQMEGFKKQYMSLRGNFRSTIADLYQPALAPLTLLIKKTNELVSFLGLASQKNKALGKSVSAVSLGATVTTGAVAITLAGAGIYYGRKVLKGAGGLKGILRGVTGASAGIAQGKAVEAATGVRPVFVTNWPANFGSSVVGAGAGAAGGAGVLKKTLPTFSKYLGKIPGLLKALPLAIAGKFALAAAVGYTAGSWIESSFIKGRIGDSLYDYMHPESKKTKNENRIYVNLQLDERGRMYAESNDHDTWVEVRGTQGAAGAR